MKKFGTPNGAGPGNANEYVGFAADGTPPADRGVAGLAGAGEITPPPPLVLGGADAEGVWLDAGLF
jgi:hypothetical protein